jgi:DNA-binding CsgD family transcriptional regulator
MSVVESRLTPSLPPASVRSGWRRRGAELANRAAELVARAKELLGSQALDQVDREDPARAAELVATMTSLCVERLREHPPKAVVSQKVCELVCDLQQLALELYEHEMVSRTRRIAACETGLARLRSIVNSADLVDRACEELCRSCGFDRAVLGKVEDGQWTPWISHFEHPETMEEWTQAWMDTVIPLDDMILETELLTERRPELVHDTTGPKIHPIISEGMSHSYVVAPVMPAGNVVGFLHADQGITGRRCETTDRDVLWAFAEGFGHIYERTVLLERLRAQREKVRATLGSVEAAMSALTDAGLELAAQPDPLSWVAPTAVSVLTTMSANLEELTPRELEVLELMVSGAKNQKIAEQLVITPGTVKSHVKHILRKLGAVNRSQAIAQYLGVLNDPDD